MAAIWKADRARPPKRARLRWPLRALVSDSVAMPVPSNVVPDGLSFPETANHSFIAEVDVTALHCTWGLARIALRKEGVV